MKSWRLASPQRWSAPAAAVIVGIVLALDASAQSSVIKCIDVDGNTTYQDAPCEPGQAGHDLAVPKAGEGDPSSQWETAAREHRVIRGMPKRWVLRARGAPEEIRPGSARDQATEIWRYAAARGNVTLVGFAGPDVSWIREDVAVASLAPPPPPAGDAGARGAHNRRFVIKGRYCEHVFAEIGIADRQEPVTTQPGAGGKAVPVIRYVYEPAAGDPQMRTVFSCAGGKVADVERTLRQVR